MGNVTPDALWQSLTVSVKAQDKELLNAIVEDIETHDGSTTTSAVIRRLIRQEAVRRNIPTLAALYTVSDAETAAYLAEATA